MESTVCFGQRFVCGWLGFTFSDVSAMCQGFPRTKNHRIYLGTQSNQIQLQVVLKKIADLIERVYSDDCPAIDPEFISSEWSYIV